MSREIKFRYLYKDEIYKSNKVKTIILTLEDIESGKAKELHTILCREQYTGIKDKNGVEIYVSDVVNLEVANNCEYVYENINDVYNHNTKFVNIKISFIEGCFVLYSDFIDDDKKMLWLWNNLEVVGNESENKELLNETK